jgi:hypothetical protein
MRDDLAVLSFSLQPDEIAAIERLN